MIGVDSGADGLWNRGLVDTDFLVAPLMHVWQDLKHTMKLSLRTSLLIVSLWTKWMVCAAESAGGERWVSLLKGGSLDGWVQKGGKARYRVEGDQIVGTPVPGTGNSFLCTVGIYTNFVLELEFKTDPGLNSGVQVRSHAFEGPTEFEDTARGKTVKISAGRVHGYQVEIDPSPRAWSGGIYDEARRGWLHDLKENEAARKAYKTNDWNHFRIEASPGRLQTTINGVPAADLRDTVSPAGFIALQVHSVGTRTNAMEVRFRGLRILERP